MLGLLLLASVSYYNVTVWWNGVDVSVAGCCNASGEEHVNATNATLVYTVGDALRIEYLSANDTLAPDLIVQMGSVRELVPIGNLSSLLIAPSNASDSYYALDNSSTRWSIIVRELSPPPSAPPETETLYIGLNLTWFATSTSIVVVVVLVVVLWYVRRRMMQRELGPRKDAGSGATRTEENDRPVARPAETQLVATDNNYKTLPYLPITAVVYTKPVPIKGELPRPPQVAVKTISVAV